MAYYLYKPPDNQNIKKEVLITQACNLLVKGLSSSDLSDFEYHSMVYTNGCFVAVVELLLYCFKNGLSLSL